MGRPDRSRGFDTLASAVARGCNCERGFSQGQQDGCSASRGRRPRCRPGSWGGRMGFINTDPENIPRFPSIHEAGDVAVLVT
jgi:hypothetical protein